MLNYTIQHDLRSQSPIIDDGRLNFIISMFRGVLIDQSENRIWLTIQGFNGL